jgi:hypothetical protein
MDAMYWSKGFRTWIEPCSRIVATPFRKREFRLCVSHLPDSVMSSLGGRTPAMDGEIVATARILITQLYEAR